MKTLNLNTASRIVDAALDKAHKLSLAPLSVVVLDAGGHLIAAKREDGASFMRCDIASGKAYGCLAMGLGGRELTRKVHMAPVFMNAISTLAGGKVVPVPGGVLVRNESGELLGAVGISGDSPGEDEACAITAITIAGLRADHGDPTQT